MTEFIIASQKDTDTIAAIARETWPHTFGNLMPEDQIAYMLDLMYSLSALHQQMAEGHHFLMIHHKNNPVGYTSYELNYKDKPQLMVHKVYLLPSSQGSGIGKKTFGHLMEIAKENEQNSLRLKVFHKNTQAIGFYEKKGFAHMGTEKTDIGHGYTILDHIMVKKLD